MRSAQHCRSQTNLTDTTARSWLRIQKPRDVTAENADNEIFCGDVSGQDLADAIKKKVCSEAVIEALLIELRRCQLAHQLETKVYTTYGGRNDKEVDAITTKFNNAKTALSTLLTQACKKEIRDFNEIAVDSVGLELEEILCDLPSIVEAKPT